MKIVQIDNFKLNWKRLNGSILTVENEPSPNTFPNLKSLAVNFLGFRASVVALLPVPDVELISK